MLLCNHWAEDGMDPLKVETVAACREALQRNPLGFSCALRAPMSEAAREENTALHQRHGERERERFHCLTAKAVTVPLLTGCCVTRWSKSESLLRTQKSTTPAPLVFLVVHFTISSSESFCLFSGTFGICRQGRKPLQLAAWK